MTSEPSIYFHVGLGKTGSTFLQDRFFPRLMDIDYLLETGFILHIHLSPITRLLGF